MSTIIPPSQLIDSVFTTSNIAGTIRYKNTIYHNKRSFSQTRKWIEPNTFKEVIEREWRIPFSVDNNLPVSEITERIDYAMDKIGLYTYWKINYNDYTISAYVRVTEDKI